MNVLFITVYAFGSLKERTIYADLVREFVKNGHKVYCICPVERRSGLKTHIVREDHATILRLRIGNMQKTNAIEKGISTLTIEPSLVRAVKTYFSKVKFDLALYSTPPITMLSAIEYVKKRDGARTYLLLKDIFPQNAVDLGMMKTTGWKGALYRSFRKKEKRLYRVSDRIGCMSRANVDYVLKHNPEADPKKVEVCPNSIDVTDTSVDAKTRERIRKKYRIPLNRTVFVYGGNLGKPQGISFLIQCLKECRDLEDAYFLIVGDGTEYSLLRDYLKKSRQKNARLIHRLPKEEYDTMIGACDVGMIILDHRFTIPNFPSRLLYYMQAGLPVLAATDPNTDIGKVIEDGGFGWWCESNSTDAFMKLVQKALAEDRQLKGNAGYQYLTDHYSVRKAYDMICADADEKMRRQAV